MGLLQAAYRWIAYPKFIDTVARSTYSYYKIAKDKGGASDLIALMNSLSMSLTDYADNDNEGFRYRSEANEMFDREVNSGRDVGLLTIGLIFIKVYSGGFSESPTKTANRLIQAYYKLDASRFLIEGKPRNWGDPS